MKEAKKSCFINMRVESIKVVVLFVTAYVILHVVFGPFWSIKGIFFRGIKSQKEFYRVSRERRETQDLHKYYQSDYVKLLGDGSGHFISEKHFIYKGRKPVETYSFANDSADIVILKVLDEKERELPFEVLRKANYRRYTVRLRRSIRPGERFIIKTVYKINGLIKREKALSVCKMRLPFRSEVSYDLTVVLPPGAQIVFAQPEPVQKYKTNESLALRFEAHLGKNESFEGKIKYMIQGVIGE